MVWQNDALRKQDINEARYMRVTGDGWLAEARFARARHNRTSVRNGDCACQGL